MGKKSSPSTPDVVGAAEAQGAQSRETARDTTYADRPDQYNPFGSIEWSTQTDIDPATGEPVTRWVQNQKYDPSVMNILNQNMGTMGERAALANQLSGRLAGEMGSDPDWDQFGDVQQFNFDPEASRQKYEDDYYARQTRRLDPQFEQREKALDIKLRNQGLRPGDQAYDAQMASFGRQRSDAYEMARLGATQGGMQEQQMAFQEQLAANERANQLRQRQIEEFLGKRGYTLDEINKLQEGQTTGDIANMAGGGGG
jgi:hypothetical protein